MTELHALDLMNEVIEGSASEAARAELVNLIGGDAALRKQFDDLRGLAALLAQMPELDPPAGLAARVMAEIAVSANNRTQTDQLSSVSAVSGRHGGDFVSATAQPPLVSRLLQLFQFHQENFMTAVKKGLLRTTRSRVLAGGGLALVALVVVSSAIDFPATDKNAAGTIAPAQRYRSGQAPDANVQAGSSSQSPAVGTTGAEGVGAAKSIAGDKISADKMSVDKMSVDKMAGDKMVGGKLAGDKMGGDKMVGGKLAGDKMGGDKMGAGKSAL